MNSEKFEIALMVDNAENILHVYNWYLIPFVGDKLILPDNKIFIVKERLLQTNNSNKVTLFGDVSKFDLSDDF